MIVGSGAAHPGNNPDHAPNHDPKESARQMRSDGVSLFVGETLDKRHK